MGIILYALLWLSFGLGHSITAKIDVQRKLIPFFGKYYRLCYNLFAAAHILLVLYLGTKLLSTNTFSIVSNFTFVMNLVQLAGLVFILLALRQYDLKEFSGLSAFLSDKTLVNKTSGNTPGTEKLEPLNTGGLNHWVRHPLYTGAFVYLWGGASSELGFFTALLGSLYLTIGSSHEEKKLLRLYGQAYRDYQAKVPRFFPF